MMKFQKSEVAVAAALVAVLIHGAIRILSRKRKEDA